MKEEGIRIRINSQLKNEFKKICESENTTMSEKLNWFIKNEIDTKKLRSIEEQVYDIIDHKNLTIVHQSAFLVDSDGNVVDKDVEGSRVLMVSEWRLDWIKFFEIVKDKKVYLFLGGCDFKNGHIRAAVI
jgi:hypothetical protein